MIDWLHMQPVFSDEDQKIIDNALQYVKDNKKSLIEKYAGPQFPVVTKPTSFFMAGSPGAGKTEVSKYLLSLIAKTDSEITVSRVDGDEIRNELPGYNGSNAWLFQRVISKAIEPIHDALLNQGKDFILDGTLASYEKAKENIHRSVKRDRIVVIVYVYQDPVIAWKFTQKREALEGRNIPKEAFIEACFSSRENVRRLKDEYGNAVEIWYVERNIENDEYRFELKVQDINGYNKIPYTKEQLEAILQI